VKKDKLMASGFLKKYEQMFQQNSCHYVSASPPKNGILPRKFLKIAIKKCAF
jgi:hypothetical protein